MKAEKFPVTITEKGVSAVIRKAMKLKGGQKLHYFIVEYVLLGKRKQVWRSDLDEAKALAREACVKIANGEQSALELTDNDRVTTRELLKKSKGGKRATIPGFWINERVVRFNPRTIIAKLADDAGVKPEVISAMLNLKIDPPSS